MQLHLPCMNSSKNLHVYFHDSAMNAVPRQFLVMQAKVLDHITVWHITNMEKDVSFIKCLRLLLRSRGGMI